MTSLLKGLSIKSFLSLSILILINLLFCFKYLDRILPKVLIPLILMLFFYVLIWKYRNIYASKIKHFNLFIFALIAVFVGLSSIVLSKISLDSIMVDRWSVITSFWESFFNNEFVYYSKSFAGNPPGAMPFYFILALPFLLVGELGLLPILGLLIFLVILSKSNVKKSDFLWGIIFLITSFFIIWEIPTRSNLFMNSTLFLGLLFLVNHISINRVNNKFIIVAVLAGLILSTRFVLLIPVIILFMWLLRSKGMTLGRLMLFGAIALISFLGTFIPFVINHFDDFLLKNPFLLQSTLFIPFYYTIFFIFLAFLFSFLCKNSNDVYFFSGFTLFISIAIYFVYHIAVFGFTKAYLGSVADISYFILCTPFLIYYLVAANNDRSIDNQHLKSV